MITIMEKRVAISLKLPPGLLKAIDVYRERQTYKATRTQVIEEAVKGVIERAAEKGRGKK
jgi:metal-responsive CopG/Arc/MetJ family transcriptional regulator